MNKRHFQSFMTFIQNNIASGKAKLEQDVPRLERNLKIFAEKVGIEPENIDRAKEKIRERLEKIQKQK